jgi:hypothetical protein
LCDVACWKKDDPEVEKSRFVLNMKSLYSLR